MINKVFGIGLPRTATRSLTKALGYLGYRTAHYFTTYTWLEADFETDVLENIDAVTDTPVPIYYPELDKRYPGSKFIYSTRTTESWLRSIQKHQSAKLSDSEFDQKRLQYRLLTYGMYVFSPERYRYVKETHDINVKWYFRNRPNDILTLDICSGDGWDKLCSFLNKPRPDQPFPNIP